MYKQYWNDYEKRAEQIKKAAHTIEPEPEKGKPVNPPFIAKSNSPAGQNCETIAANKLNGTAGLFGRFSKDDILLLALLFVLISSEKKDTTLIVILGYLFLSGL